MSKDNVKLWLGGVAVVLVAAFVARIAIDSNSTDLSKRADSSFREADASSGSESAERSLTVTLNGVEYELRWVPLEESDLETLKSERNRLSDEERDLTTLSPGCWLPPLEPSVELYRKIMDGGGDDASDSDQSRRQSDEER